MIINLVHYQDDELGKAFHSLFDGVNNVNIIDGDICSLKCDAIVSPANSFGFMDGGIDYLYSLRFGWELQKRLQEKIKASPLKELLVGDAMIIPTNDQKIPYLISAPTMRVPCTNLEGTINAYLAMKGILSCTQKSAEIQSIAIPGLGTGSGQLNKRVCAFQMLQAYQEIILNNTIYPETFRQAMERQWHITKPF